MNWTQDGQALKAPTDYGTYTIFINPDKNIGVNLVQGSNTLMEGVHDSIGRATESAETDFAHRSTMWETI